MAVSNRRAAIGNTKNSRLATVPFSQRVARADHNHCHLLRFKLLTPPRDVRWGVIPSAHKECCERNHFNRVAFNDQIFKTPTVRQTQPHTTSGVDGGLGFVRAAT